MPREKPQEMFGGGNLSGRTFRSKVLHRHRGNHGPKLLQKLFEDPRWSCASNLEACWEKLGKPSGEKLSSFSEELSSEPFESPGQIRQENCALSCEETFTNHKTLVD